MRVLDLSNNIVHGQLPNSLGGLSNLVELELSNNQLNGIIPDGIGQLVSLSTLRMSSNFLEGTFSEMHLKNLSNLKELQVGSNKLHVKIDSNWTPPFQSLNDLQMASCNIGTQFPQSPLDWLKLSNNSLHGDLEKALKDIQVSEVLDLGRNQFTGMLTSSWIDSSKDLRVLRLTHNLLSGKIPSSLCNLPSLQILDLASNNLSGSIPSCVCNLTGMSNQSIEGIVDIDYFKEDISQFLKGLEQDYTKTLKYLINFDLSDNNLEGFIPEGITCLSGLIGLNLSYNKFSGIIPSKIDEMKSLESLDLLNNKLYGSIPINMPILTSLSILNLSNNNFSGRIPKGAQFSTFDASSYGGNTYLCGEPLSNACPGDHEITQPPTCPVYEDQSDNNEEEKEKMLFYFVIAAGYITGFWGIIGVLFLKRNWRHACFRRVEEFVDTLYVEVAIRIARVKKMMKKNQQVDQ